ncbi:MAG: hypothetical protein AAF125_13840 [Chloroflexota bacterium]
MAPPVATHAWYRPYIYLLRIQREWTWDEAFEHVNRTNAALEAASQEQEVYVIFQFEPGVSYIPRGSNALPNLRRLILNDPADEILCVFVGEVAVLKKLLNTILRVYNLFSLTTHYRFARTLDEAVALIESKRVERSSSD